MANKSGDPSYSAKAKMKAMTDSLIEAKSVGNMQKYGEAAAAMVKLRTRLGDGVSGEGEQKEKLTALSPGYIEERKKHADELSSATSPGKSNLTRTGQMLDSVTVTSVEVGRVHIGPSGSRSDSKLSNAEVAEYVSEAGRPFNNLSNIELKRMQTSIRNDIREIIKRKLTNAK